MATWSVNNFNMVINGDNLMVITKLDLVHFHFSTDGVLKKWLRTFNFST